MTGTVSLKSNSNGNGSGGSGSGSNGSGGKSSGGSGSGDGMYALVAGDYIGDFSLLFGTPSEMTATASVFTGKCSVV